MWRQMVGSSGVEGTPDHKFTQKLLRRSFVSSRADSRSNPVSVSDTDIATDAGAEAVEVEADWPDASMLLRGRDDVR
jgi:hypothetical protein